MISQETQELINLIRTTISSTKFENKAFIAGGFVRDMKLGKDNKDIDICVELPNGGIELCEFLAKELHGTNLVLFETYGTAQTVINGMELEFVMTRKETYRSDDRNPECVFGTIQDDVLRRDFTINSMLLNISTGEVLDLYNGEQDLKDGIIRTTSDPEIIFNDDPLRILRAIRFACRFNCEIEKNTFDNIKKFAPKLLTLSHERVRDEFMKILSCDMYLHGITLLTSLECIRYIGLPELEETIGMEQNTYHSADVHGHIFDVMSNIKGTSFHRLAALLHDIGKVNTRTKDNKGFHFYGHEIESAKIAERFMKHLKFSSDEIDLVVSAVGNHMRISSDITSRKLRQIRSQLGDKKFEFLLDLCEADRISHVDKSISHITNARIILENETLINSQTLLVKGEEIMEMFDLKPGKEVGKLLEFEKETMFNNPTITKDEMIKKLKYEKHKNFNWR